MRTDSVAAEGEKKGRRWLHGNIVDINSPSTYGGRAHAFEQWDIRASRRPDVR